MKGLTQVQKDKLVKIASKYIYDASPSQYRQELTITERGILAILTEYEEMDVESTVSGKVVYKGKTYDTGNTYNELVELYENGKFVITVKMSEIRKPKNNSPLP